MLTKSESSRVNGAKSRGPVTPEGKQRSAMNGVRHALLAKTICLNIERQDIFQEVLNDYVGRYHPDDNVELRFIEQAAMAQFRYERSLGTETAMYVLHMDHQASDIAKKYLKVDPPTRFAITFKGLGDDSHGIQLMLRYQAAMLRQRDSALKQFDEIRKKHPLPTEPEPSEPERNEPPESNEPRATNYELRPPLPSEPTAPLTPNQTINIREES